MKMLVGLTGRTGSGKTSATRIFEKLGAFVVNCDKVAHSALLNPDVKEKLSYEFKNGIFDENNVIDRKKLGSIVFSDSKKLAALNKIVHPFVTETALMMCESSGKDICILDGSELEESGIYKKCNTVIVITADDDIRLLRITKRDNISREDALKRMNSQKEFSKDAVFIKNCGDISALEKKITELYNKFLGELNE